MRANMAAVLYNSTLSAHALFLYAIDLQSMTHAYCDDPFRTYPEYPTFKVYLDSTVYFCYESGS